MGIVGGAFILEVSWLGLNLTNACNMACKYCSVDAKPKGIFVEDGVVKKFISYFSKYANPGTLVTISGGEPTLHPHLIDFVDELKSSLIAPEIYITTNGVVNERLVLELLKRKVKFQVSFEGLPEIHDFERPLLGNKPSSKQVIKTIRQIAEFNPELLYVRVNYSPKKFGRELEIAEFLSKLGVKYVSIGILAKKGRGKNYPYIDEIKSMSQEKLFYDALASKGITVPIRFREDSIIKWPSCGAGEYAFFLTADGKVSACQSIITTQNLPNALKKLILGDVRTQILDENARRSFLKFAKFIPDACKKCPAFETCSGCPYERALSGGVFTKFFCETSRLRDNFLKSVKKQT